LVEGTPWVPLLVEVMVAVEVEVDALVELVQSS